MHAGHDARMHCQPAQVLHRASSRGSPDADAAVGVGLPVPALACATGVRQAGPGGQKARTQEAGPRDRGWPCSCATRAGEVTGADRKDAQQGRGRDQQGVEERGRRRPYAWHRSTSCSLLRTDARARPARRGRARQIREGARARSRPRARPCRPEAARGDRAHAQGRRLMAPARGHGGPAAGRRPRIRQAAAASTRSTDKHPAVAARAAAEVLGAPDRQGVRAQAAIKWLAYFNSGSPSRPKKSKKTGETVSVADPHRKVEHVKTGPDHRAWCRRCTRSRSAPSASCSSST